MSGPLVVAGEVIDVKPIPNADRIRLATVSCGSAGIWSGVVGLDVEVPDDVVVFLQDALLPPDARWAFMEKQKWRVKMCRFRGAPSECLILKAELPHMHEIGSDLTELYGVTKYEKPVPSGSAGDILGNFPSWIAKTDEDNFQRVPELVSRMKVEPWYATVKADGTSCTVWNDEDGLHVCSRNFELKEFTESGATNLYWRMARQFRMDQLPTTHAIQFEIVGPGVQGNPMGLTVQTIRVFHVYDIVARRMLSSIDMIVFCAAHVLPQASFVANNLSHTIESDDDLRSLAAIKYDNGKPGEGVVVRACDGTWSFKILNLEYKD